MRIAHKSDRHRVCLRLRVVVGLLTLLRQRYGVAPRVFDVESFRLQRRAEWLNAAANPRERLAVQRLPRGCNPDGFTVRLRRLPARHVGHLQFPAMQVAELEIRGGVDLELRAIDWLYRTWLPTSGYVPTEQPAFEAFLGRPFAHSDEYFELRAQLPVMRA